MLTPQRAQDLARERSKGRRRKAAARLFWRDQGGRPRAYGDFRSLGGGLEALIPRGEKQGTTDPEIAAVLFGERLKELEQQRRHMRILGYVPDRLEDFAARHLETKLAAGKVTGKHVEGDRHRLKVAVEFFGADRQLDTITVADVEAWLVTLRERPNGMGGTLSTSSQRAFLNTLSNLYRRAIGQGVVPAGYNPAAGVMEKPSPQRYEAKWLQPHEAALLLESARTYRPKRADVATPGFYAILATMLLTGGRKSEVLGLAVTDVSFDRGTVTFRPHPWRRLKTLNAPRVVPLWPQLRSVLRDHLFGRDAAAEGLLFPNQDGGMVGDFDKTLDQVAQRCGWAPGEVRSKAFRHTYCATRLQTTDKGAPVSPFTLVKELGHGGRQLVDRVYGHLGEVRRRSEVVEFHATDFRRELDDRLTALEATGGNG